MSDEEDMIYGRTAGQDTARGGAYAGALGGQEARHQGSHHVRLAQAI